MDEKQIVKKYLGIQFHHMGRDIKAGLDCWGLVLCVYADMGVILMDVGSYDVDWSKNGEDYFLENYYKHFESVDDPRIMDVILFKNALGVAHHAGIYLSEGRFIHACKAGVVITTMTRHWKEKLVGAYRLKR